VTSVVDEIEEVLYLFLDNPPAFAAAILSLLAFCLAFPLVGVCSWLIGLGAGWGFFIASVTVVSPELLEKLGFVLAAVGWYLVTVLLHDASAEPVFYEAAAQVIPTLFIALAIEARFSAEDQTFNQQLLRVGVVLALVAGEIGSLYALATSDPVGGTFGWVAGALAGAAVAAVVAALAS
jgi:hypothetical protein